MHPSDAIRSRSQKSPDSFHLLQRSKAFHLLARRRQAASSSSSSSTRSLNGGRWESQQGRSADEEANVGQQMSLHPEQSADPLLALES